ncbi:YqzK family protein [Lentibacillus juripiscarius]|uniref:YqzK family protein n=1 Tax=Lentibacillus juripiscarius TaxID=257446 RepID=A0ABW5VCB7_9BACI
MKQLLWDTLKVFVIFIVCTCLFYAGLRYMHAEYKQYHRYDPPEGPAVKVFNTETDESFIDRLNLFFRLGE